MQSHFKNMTACCQLLTDILESRKDVVHLSKPYQKCPVYETPSFLLRLVQLDDAQDLPACYSDRGGSRQHERGLLHERFLL